MESWVKAPKREQKGSQNPRDGLLIIEVLLWIRKLNNTVLQKLKVMINFPLLIEGLLLPLLGLGIFIVYKRVKRKKRKFHAPPSKQLPS